jgi:hypothetical protein
MQLTLSDLLSIIPARNNVGSPTARYWLKTSLFGAIKVRGGGGPGQPLTVNFHGAAMFLVASELYSFGISGIGFEQALLTLGPQVKQRWRDLADLASEAPTLRANNGEESLVELAVAGRDDDGEPLFKVQADWTGANPLKAGAIIRLNLLEVLGPLIAMAKTNMESA